MQRQPGGNKGVGVLWAWVAMNSTLQMRLVVRAEWKPGPFRSVLF